MIIGEEVEEFKTQLLRETWKWDQSADKEEVAKKVKGSVMAENRVVSWEREDSTPSRKSSIMSNIAH